MLDVKASMQLTIVTLGMSNLEPIFQEKFSSLFFNGTDGLFENKSNSGSAGLKAF